MNMSPLITWAMRYEKCKEGKWVVMDMMRNGQDYIYGTWQYKVFSIEKLFERKKMMCLKVMKNCQRALLVYSLCIKSTTFLWFP